MGQQSVRQAARKTALDVRAARRVARAQRERRLDTLTVEVHVALRERDAAVAAIERRAGQALHAMTSEEGLTLREAVNWCGAGLTLRGRAGYAGSRPQKTIHGKTLERRDGDDLLIKNLSGPGQPLTA